MGFTFGFKVYRAKGLSKVEGLGVTFGSKDPNNRVLGPKYYTINGI